MAFGWAAGKSEAEDGSFHSKHSGDGESPAPDAAAAIAAPPPLRRSSPPASVPPLRCRGGDALGGFATLQPAAGAKLASR